MYMTHEIYLSCENVIKMLLPLNCVCDFCVQCVMNGISAECSAY